MVYGLPLILVTFILIMMVVSFKSLHHFFFESGYKTPMNLLISNLVRPYTASHKRFSLSFDWCHPGSVTNMFQVWYCTLRILGSPLTLVTFLFVVASFK